MIGRTIGHYKIVRALKESRTGGIYLAEHPMAGKRIAIKILRPDFARDPGLASRFFRAARAVNDIRHPNIVDISDFGHTDDGVVYYVMELLEGMSLRDRLSELGPMPIEQAATTARQVADALAAAHRVGIVHRDVKPDHIFLVADLQAPGGIRSKLLDFGLAKMAIMPDTSETMPGSVVGTPFYMSPEQVLGHEVGPATDIYAMGVVIFEMLTGQVPFRSEQLLLLLNAILKQPAPPPSQARPEVPPWLDRLVLRCLEKDPDARPHSMAEICAVLAAGMGEMAPARFGVASASTAMPPVTVARTIPPWTAGTAERTSAATGATNGRTATATQAVARAVSARAAVPRQAAVGGGVAGPPEPQVAAVRMSAVRGGVARRADSPKSIFICYRREDTQWAAVVLRDRLVSKLSKSDVFMDIDSIEPGADFGEAIDDALERCTLVLLLIGPRWSIPSVAGKKPRLAEPDDYVRRELEAALNLGRRIVPLFFDGSPMPPENQWPPSLQSISGRQGINVPGTDLDNVVDRIVGWIREG